MIKELFRAVFSDGKPGTVTIDGVPHVGNDISIVIDGVVVNTISRRPVNINVRGDVDILEANQGDVFITGDVNTVRTSQGDISVVGNVAGNVSTSQGDVHARLIYGSASTSQGDIYGANV